MEKVTYVYYDGEKLTAFVGPKEPDYTNSQGSSTQGWKTRMKDRFLRKMETAKASRLPVVNTVLSSQLESLPPKFIFSVDGHDLPAMKLDTPVELEGWEVEVVMSDGWQPTYNNPDNSGLEQPSEPIAYRLKRSEVAKKEHLDRCECLGTKDARGNCDSSCAKKHEELYGAGDDYPVIENTWDVPAPLTRRKDRHYAEEWGKYKDEIFGLNPENFSDLLEQMSNTVKEALKKSAFPPAALAPLHELNQKIYRDFRERREKSELDNKDVFAPGAFDGVDFGHSNDAASYAVYGLGRGGKRDVLDYYKTFNELSKKQKARKKTSQSRYKKYYGRKA